MNHIRIFAKRGLDSICTSQSGHFRAPVLMEHQTMADFKRGLGRHVKSTVQVDDDPKMKAAIKLAAKIALSGKSKRIGGYTWQARWKPYCDSPVRVEVAAGAKARLPVVAIIDVPCRKCSKCLQYRQMKWRSRAMNEIMKTHEAGRRTWWVTLTFSPVHLAGVLSEAAAAGAKTLVMIERKAYGHVSRYLDRLRKAARTRFRYLAVYERGEETGRSHYHLLLHEVGPFPLLKATIENLWRSHVHARLVHVTSRTTGLATYISKYATKTVEIRPRASLKYGRIETRSER